MTERMSWKDDERLYQPRIHSQRIRELYKLSQDTGQPMTVIIDLALRRFLENPALIPYSDASPENPVFEARGEPVEPIGEGSLPILGQV